MKKINVFLIGAGIALCLALVFSTGCAKQEQAAEETGEIEVDAEGNVVEPLKWEAPNTP
ncbi:MAG: hypothetical protein WBB73_05455 [Candidatus Aminicenantaceae bacterium]